MNYFYEPFLYIVGKMEILVGGGGEGFHNLQHYLDGQLNNRWLGILSFCYSNFFCFFYYK